MWTIPRLPHPRVPHVCIGGYFHLGPVEVAPDDHSILPPVGPSNLSVHEIHLFYFDRRAANTRERERERDGERERGRKIDMGGEYC